MTQYKLVLVDDHQVVINGLIHILETEPLLHIEQTVDQVKDLFPTLQKVQPHLLILDINMQGENTFAFIPRIKKDFPQLKIILFSSYNAPAFRKEATRLGVHAFLTKDTSDEQLLQTIYKLLKKGKSKEKTLLKNAKQSPQKDQFYVENILSKRELEILILVAKGNNSQQIAEQLFLSKHTVQWHRKNIIAKLELKSANEMIRFAYKHGLVI